MARNSAFDTYMQKIKPAKSKTEVTNLSCSGPFICNILDLEHTNDLSENKQNHRVSEDIVKCTTVSLSRGKACVFRKTERRNCQETETRSLLSKRSDESSTSLGSSDQESGGSVEKRYGLRTKDQNGGGGVLRNTDLETIDQYNGESVERSSRLGTRDKNSGKSVEARSRVKTRDNNSEKGVDRSTSLEIRDKNSGESVERSSRLETRDKNSVNRSTSLETTVKKLGESVEKSSMEEIRDCNSGKSVQMSTRLETRDQTSGKRKKNTGKTERSKKRKSDKPLSSYNSAKVDPGLFQVVHQISPCSVVYKKTEQVIEQQHADDRDNSILRSCTNDFLNESPLLATNACVVANTSVNSNEKTLEEQEYHAENISTTEVTNRETGIQNFKTIESEAENFRGQRQCEYENKVRSRKKNKPIYNRELASIVAGNDVNVSTEDHISLRKQQKIDYTATEVLRCGQKAKANKNESSNNKNVKEHTVEHNSGNNGQEKPVITDATSEGSSIESMHFKSTNLSTGEISDEKSWQCNESKDVSETDSNTSLSPSPMDTYMDSERSNNTLKVLNTIKCKSEHFRGQRQGLYERKVKSRKKNKPIYNRELASILKGNDVDVSSKEHRLRKRQKIDYTATKVLRYGDKEKTHGSGSSNYQSEKEHTVEEGSGIDGQETPETTNATSEDSSIEPMQFGSTAHSAGKMSDQNSQQVSVSKAISETDSNISLSPCPFLVNTYLDSKRSNNDDLKNQDPFFSEDDVVSSTSATKNVSDIDNISSSCEEINQDLYKALIWKQAKTNKQKHVELIYKRKYPDILSDSEADISEKGHDLRQQQKVDYTANMIGRLGLNETKLKNDLSDTNRTKIKNGKFNQDTERKEHEDSRSIKFIPFQSVMKSFRDSSDDDVKEIDRNGTASYTETDCEFLEFPYLMNTFSDSEKSADDLLTQKQDVLKENKVASSGTEYTSDVENDGIFCHSDSTVEASSISITADPVRLQQKTIDSFFPSVKQGNDGHKNFVFSGVVSDKEEVYSVEKTNEEDSLSEMLNYNSMINSEAVAYTKTKDATDTLYHITEENSMETSMIEHEINEYEDSGCPLDIFSEARIHSDCPVMEIPTSASCSNINQKGDQRGSILHGGEGKENPCDEESGSVNDDKSETYHVNEILIDANNNLQNKREMHVHEVDGNLGTVSARDVDELQELATATATTINKDVHPGIELTDVRNENKKEHLEVGSIVWAVFGKRYWWPAMVVSSEQAKKTTKAGWVWIFWLSDDKISQVKECNVEPFKQQFTKRRRHKSRRWQENSFMKNGVNKALELCALRANIDVSMYENISCWADDNNGFLTIDSSRYKPLKDNPVPSWILEKLGFEPMKASQDESCLEKTRQRSEILNPSSMTMPSSTAGRSKNCERSNNLLSVNTLCATDSPSSASVGYDADWDSNQEDIAVVDGQGRSTEAESCLGCGECTGLDYRHPLFVGKICIKCKDSLKESFYAIDEDDCSMFCDVCGEGGSLYVCSNDKCGKSFCFDCVDRLTNKAVIKLIKETNQWKCFLCTEYSASTHGGLVPRKDRALETVRFFQAGNIPLCTDLHYMSSGERRKIRVLSLFDGIGSGMLALDELGFDVEVYYVSEIDRDAMLVCDYQHHPVQLGDACGLNTSKLEEICPIDLVLGGPPCNDLSIVNPDRKGFNGTGILVFKFAMILKTIEFLCKGKNHVFWLMENTGSMLNTYKKAICDLLEMEPAVWDAKYFTGQRRARNFWGNIPGMYSVPKFCKQLEKDKKCLDSALIANCNRTANISHTRTITTSSNSLTITNGVNNALVTMNGKPDHIWVQELERLFGFPTHYTDVGHLTLEKRRKLLGKAWCVPVIKHLLAPLKQYFKLKDM